MELRDYQKEMLSRLCDAWAQCHSVMVQMPTGTGKTVLLAEVLRHMDGEVLVVAHRRELLAQITATLGRFGIGGDRVRVESIQRLAWSGCPSFTPSLVVIDEAHHAVARTYRQLWEWWPDARFLGLTATPCRLGGQGFTDLFEVLLQSAPIQEFIDRGWLSDFEYVSASPESEALRQVAQFGKRGADGDYQVKEMATVMDVPESVAHLYDTYREFAAGRKGIVYAIDREHARHIAEHYRAQGVRCAVIDARTPAVERRQTVEDYRLQRIDVLVNVDIFSEGYDCPEVEFIQLARPTLSLSKYLQQVGRGMRRARGKEAVMILDNVGLYQTFGLPTEERDWHQMFTGELAGKGQQGMAHPVVIKDDVREEKTLVNLEMVRIRRRSESLKGLNIYLQNGKYGVMKDGKVTTQPVFESVKRCNNGRFFALATYPYAFFRNRTTIIDLQGIDLMVQLYGQIELKGEFLYGNDIRGERLLWDTIGKSYYKGCEPKFERYGGLDILRAGKDKHNTSLYELRYTKSPQHFAFSKKEVFFNQHIAIIRDILIVKSNGFRIYKIFGYLDDSVLVYTKKQYESMQVRWDGQLGQHFNHTPDNYTRHFNQARLKLKWLE